MSLKAHFRNALDSIAWRLYAVVLLSCVLFFFSMVLWLAWDSQRDESFFFDNDMRAIATTILWSTPATLGDGAATTTFQSINGPTSQSPIDSNRTFYLQIWSADGRLLMKSPLTSAERIWPDTRPGFCWVEVGGTRWRVLNLWSENKKILVQYAQPEAMRDGIICEIFLAGAKQLAWFILGLIALVCVVVQWSLRPLKAVNAEIANRGAVNLSPIETARIPTEIKKIITPFNDLLLRLKEARINEQRFLSDAAHELRTPLAALRVQAQAALRSTQNHDREKALQKLVSGIDRTTRVAEQLLNIAHVDAAATGDNAKINFNLRQLAKDVANLLAAEAARKFIVVHIADSDCIVSGDQLTIGIAIRNVLENAVRYSPTGGCVVINAANVNRVPTLSVSDSGPGIPATERAKVLERFYRLHASVAEGSGLGLAIVKQVCDSIGATLTLADASRQMDEGLFAESSRQKTEGVGLRVTIQFAPI